MIGVFRCGLNKLLDASTLIFASSSRSLLSAYFTASTFTSLRSQPVNVHGAVDVVEFYAASRGKRICLVKFLGHLAGMVRAIGQQWWQR